MTQFTWTLSLLFAMVALPLLAAEEPAKKPTEKKPAAKDDAEESALEATLKAKVDSYALAKDQQGEKFRKLIEDPENRNVPEPPTVDLMLELKNPTDKTIVIVLGADNGALELDLQGTGAVTIHPVRIMTREFRRGKGVEIPAGKTYELPIKQLKYGMRGVGSQSYWTEHGEYTLGATLRWPDHNSPDGGQPKRLKASAKPIKLTVKSAE